MMIAKMRMSPVRMRIAGQMRRMPLVMPAIGMRIRRSTWGQRILRVVKMLVMKEHRRAFRPKLLRNDDGRGNPVRCTPKSHSTGRGSWRDL